MGARSRNPLPLGKGAAFGPPPARGFTLLELLVVAGILVLVAGGVVLSLDTTRDSAAAGLVQHELTEIQRAMVRFRADTGHFPKCGPFALVSDGGRIDPSNDAHWPPDAPNNASDRASWFASPANFYQLCEPAGAPSFQAALDFVAGPGLVYAPQTRRGYLGPYLARHGEGYVLVGDALGADGEGDPTGGNAIRVPGIADAFPDAGFSWTDSPLGLAPVPLGQPYLYFPEGALGPRVVSLGENGAYESDAGAIGGDDLAVFLDGEGR